MSCTPVLSQDGFLGRNDNGSETTATAKAAENGNWTQAVDTNFRIRLHVQVTNACAASNKTFQLQYSLDGGTYTTVNGSSSVVRSSASPNVADGATTTDQMTVGSGTFQGASAFDEVDGLCGGPSLDIAASGHTEVEFCVQIRGADVSNGQTVQLRVSSTNLASWTQVPSITVNKPATATLDKTLGALTLAADGDVAVNASVTKTLGALTGAGTATVSVSATLAKTLGAATLVSTGTVASSAVEGTLDATLGAVTLEADTDVYVTASLSQSLGALTLAGQADADVAASLTKTLGLLTVASNATVAIVGTLDKSLGAVTLASSGKADVKAWLIAGHILTEGGGLIELETGGALVLEGPYQLGVLTLTASGVVGELAAEGSLDATLGAVTSVAEADVGVAASLDQSLDALTLAAEATAEIKATLAQALGDLSLAATAAAPATAILSRSLGALTATAQGEADIKATLTKELSALELTAQGEHEGAIEGTLDATLAAATANAAASVEIKVSVSAGLAALAVSAAARSDITGTLAKELGSVTLDSQIFEENTGTLAATLADLTAAITAEVIYPGVTVEILAADYHRGRAIGVYHHFAGRREGRDNVIARSADIHEGVEA